VWVLAERLGTRGRLLEVMPDGTVHTFPVPGSAGVFAPSNQCLAQGVDGRLWFFLNNSGGEIAALDPGSGRMQVFTLPSPNSDPRAIAAAPDGSIWFTETNPAGVGRIDAGGRTAEFRLPQGVTSGLTSIAVMPDGSVWTNPWYVVPNHPYWLSLTELSARGSVVHQLAVGRSGAAEFVAQGPNGMPWFSWGSVPWGVGEVLPGPRARTLSWNYFNNPSTMVLGPDGNMWVAYPLLNHAGEYGVYNSRSHSATIFEMPASSSELFAMVTGPDNTIAISASDGYIYEITTGASSSVSSIAESLPTPLQAFASVTAVAAGAAISIGAILFITFPSNLFNLTVQENYAEIRSWWQRRLRWIPRTRVSAGAEHGRARRGVGFAAVVLIGSLFGGLLDPGFGSSITTLYAYVAVVLAFCAGAAVPALITRAYHAARHEDTTWSLHALPAGLVVSAVCVVISRLADFEPGYLYGVICGVSFAAKLSATQKGHIVALCSLGSLLVAVAAWLIWVPVNDAATAPNAFAGLVIIDDLLAAVFVSGLVGSVISLLPLRFLPGWDLRAWHRGIWFGCFALAVFGLVEVLLIPHNDNHGKAPLLTTIALLVVFGGASVGLRAWFVRRRRHSDTQQLSMSDRIRELLTPVAALPDGTHGELPGHPSDP